MGKGKKKKKGEVIIDNVNTTVLKTKQLKTFAVRVKEEIDREDEEGEWYRIERDKLILNLKIDQKKEEELKAKLRDSERKREEKHALCREKHVQITQSDKHVMFELNEKMMKFKMECKKNHQNLVEEFNAQEDQLQREKVELEEQLNEQSIAWEANLRNMKLNHAEEINNMKDDFERKIKEHVILSEQILNKTLDDFEMRRLGLVGAEEARKKEQMDDITRKQNREMEDLRMYYNNILANNLSLIDSLKVEAENLRAIAERCRNQSNDTISRYNNLCEKYDRTVQDIKTFNEESKNLEKYQEDLEAVTKLYDELEKGRTNLMWSSAMLEKISDRTSRQLRNLNKSEVETLLELERKKAFKRTLRCWNRTLNQVSKSFNSKNSNDCHCTK